MKKVLDYGSGRGYFAHYLASRKDSEVFGVDISADSVEFAKSHFGDVNYVLAETLPTPFETSSFDEIYLMDVLEHVDDLEEVLGEVNRLMKPGGKLTIQVPAERSERWLLKIRPTYHKEIHHVRIFQGSQMENTVSKFGFQLMKKKAKDFLENFALYYLFKKTPTSNTQLSIGDWNSSLISKIIFVVFLLFNKKVLATRLRFFPIWIITLPIGMLVESVGNRYFPKSMYYEFRKN